MTDIQLKLLVERCFEGCLKRFNQESVSWTSFRHEKNTKKALDKALKFIKFCSTEDTKLN